MDKNTSPTQQAQSTKRKMLRGIVVSDAMDKTVIVRVERFVKHPKYGKFYKVSKRHKAHDEHNAYHVGDKVGIIPSRPRSKDKAFEVVAVTK